METYITVGSKEIAEEMLNVTYISYRQNLEAFVLFPFKGHIS